MKSTLSAIRPECSSTSTQVDEGFSARSRRRISGQLGRKHFTLAPGLLSHEQPASSSLTPSFSASSTVAYDEAWSQWMHQGPRTRAESYDEAWSRVFGSAAKARSHTVVQEPFEQAPREATRPIMSRLPLDQGEQDAIAAEPTKEGSLDYLTVAEGVKQGLHPNVDSAAQVSYTRARLPVVDDESQALWQALHSLRGISDDYADGYEAAPRRVKTAPPHPVDAGADIAQCPAFSTPTSTASERALALVKRLFNWAALPSLPVNDEYTWYGVAFRSKRRVGSESMDLYEADRRSHEEAVDSGGLLLYWYGRPNAATGHNLATCVWTNRDDALRASSLPLHARAAAYAHKAYESFELHRYALRKVKGETQLRIEEWTEAV